MFKRRKFINKCKEYYYEWDTEQYGYVLIYPDGRLCPTNNQDNRQLILSKGQFASYIRTLS
jgi:hypothetical protein